MECFESLLGESEDQMVVGDVKTNNAVQELQPMLLTDNLRLQQVLQSSTYVNQSVFHTTTLFCYMIGGKT